MCAYSEENKIIKIYEKNRTLFIILHLNNLVNSVKILSTKFNFIHSVVPSDRDISWNYNEE